jgi:hypothetical protein
MAIKSACADLCRLHAVRTALHREQGVLLDTLHRVSNRLKCACMRAYFADWDELPNGTERIFWFDRLKGNARLCGFDQAVAETYCKSLNRAKIVVPLLKGGEHVCGDFRVENLGSKGFAVYCDVPGAIMAS